jgi:thymidine kinase
MSSSGKVIYYYGTVSSSKSMLLLAIIHNYEAVGWNVVVVKPALDTRSVMVETRAHVPPRKADIVIADSESLYDYKSIIDRADVILVDECQFLTSTQIDELRNIATDKDIDVICFGLRTDFNAHLFPASKRLFELADEITEVKTICSVCGKHASFNAKVDKSDNNTNVVDPSWNKFEPRCHLHFKD